MILRFVTKKTINSTQTRNIVFRNIV